MSKGAKKASTKVEKKEKVAAPSVVEPAPSPAVEKKQRKASEKKAAAPVEVKKEPEYPRPPYSMRILWVPAKIRVKVTLHKIPGQYINFDPKPDHFYLDTLKYNKKISLKFPYPDGIKVQATKESEATFQAGILTTELPITDWGTLKAQREEIVKTWKEKRQARGMEDEEEGKGKKGKKRKAPSQKDDEPEADVAAKKGSKKGKGQEKGKGKGKGKEDKPKQSDKGTEKGSDKGVENDESERPAKRPKVFLAKNAALSLVDSINQAVEDKESKQLKRESDRDSFHEKKAAASHARKEKRQQLKDQAFKDAKVALSKKKQAAREEKQLDDAAAPAPAAGAATPRPASASASKKKNKKQEQQQPQQQSKKTAAASPASSKKGEAAASKKSEAPVKKTKKQSKKA